MHQVCDLVAFRRRQSDADRVGISEKVVQISQDFLIGASQKNPDDVWVTIVERVQLQTLAHRSVADEALDLSVRVAGYILNRTAPRRLLVQTVDRHDRKDLIDRPAVG